MFSLDFGGEVLLVYVVVWVVVGVFVADAVAQFSWPPKALSIADRAYVLETGRITLEGKASDLLHDESVQKAYLGE